MEVDKEDKEVISEEGEGTKPKEAVVLKTDEVNKVEFKKEDDEEVLEMAQGKRRKKEEKGGQGGSWGQLLDNQTNRLLVQVLVSAPVLN